MIKKKEITSYYSSQNNDVNKAILEACDYLGVTIEDLKSRNKHSYIVDARRMITGLLFVKYRMNYKDIGMFMGNRTHASVIYFSDTLVKICETDEFFKKRYQNLLNKISQ
jgi:chromosomal replication initiation ATPase DnaA